jgi:hypothetical protein
MSQEVESIAEDITSNLGADVDMGDQDAEAEAAGDASELPFAEEEETAPARPSFASYLASPIVTLVIGSEPASSVLSAHQGLLEQSPYFAAACSAFVDDGTVSGSRQWRHARLVDFPSDGSSFANLMLLALNPLASHNRAARRDG